MRTLRTPSKLTGALVGLAVVAGLLVAPLPAFALPDPVDADVTALVTLSKEASVETVAPGESFSYTITLGCAPWPRGRTSGTRRARSPSLRRFPSC